MNDEKNCTCQGCGQEDCTCAGMKDAAGRAACNGNGNCAQDGCSYPAKMSRSPTAIQEAEQAPVFDYSVLDEETAYKLQGITQCVAELQKNYVWGMAYQVGQAHELLCGQDSTCETVSHVKRGRYSENTFSEWWREAVVPYEKVRWPG